MSSSTGRENYHHHHHTHPAILLEWLETRAAPQAEHRARVLTDRAQTSSTDTVTILSNRILVARAAISASPHHRAGCIHGSTRRVCGYHPHTRVFRVEGSRRGCCGARAARRCVVCGIASARTLSTTSPVLSPTSALAGCACDTCGDRCRQSSRRRQHLPNQTAAAAAGGGCEFCQRSEGEAVAVSDNHRALNSDETWVSKRSPCAAETNSVLAIPPPFGTGMELEREVIGKWGTFGWMGSVYSTSFRIERRIKNSCLACHHYTEYIFVTSVHKRNRGVWYSNVAASNDLCTQVML